MPELFQERQPFYVRDVTVKQARAEACHSTVICSLHRSKQPLLGCKIQLHSTTTLVTHVLGLVGATSHEWVQTYWLTALIDEVLVCLLYGMMRCQQKYSKQAIDIVTVMCEEVSVNAAELIQLNRKEFCNQCPGVSATNSICSRTCAQTSI